MLNGKYEIVPYNKFGARAVYGCDDGYVLAGARDRKCQGDGYWSGTAPTCETQGNSQDDVTLARHRYIIVCHKNVSSSTTKAKPQNCSTLLFRA